MLFKEPVYQIELESYIGNSAILEELAISASFIYENSQNEVPVDTGYLLESGYVDNFDTYSVVGYECSYAGYVHEVQENIHPYGKCKFLEDPAVEYIKATGSNLSFKLSITSKGVYLFITTYENRNYFSGLELNAYYHNLNTLESLNKVLELGGIV